MGHPKGQPSDAARIVRKGVIATTAISLVLIFDKTPGIQHFVDISGRVTWFFVLLAHTYFTVMWASSGGASEFWRQIGAFWRQIKDVFRRHALAVSLDNVMLRGFTNLCVVLGYLFIATGFLITFWPR